ncbi:hypothetical protein [Leptospirillum ferrooxidans]|jgi:hypothetical protein|uniref:hypothetical protein n=1 Tax=Leptospirillum ferrooxidans TaxID=180 RepID=UPI0002FCDCAC|nr:hypothetical protein [Leptospirillum ferrooxidans]
MVPAPSLFGTAARNDPVEMALAAELVEDPPLFRLGFRGHPDAVVKADMGIPPSDGGPGKDSGKGAQHFPGADLTLPPKPVLDDREEEAGIGFMQKEDGSFSRFLLDGYCSVFPLFPPPGNPRVGLFPHSRLSIRNIWSGQKVKRLFSLF